MSAINQDFVVGLDPTNFPSITGAQLAQLVNSGTLETDKGIIVATLDVAGNPDVPNASVTAKWQYYFWLRITATAAIPYVWNPNAASDVTYLKWQTIASASIGIGTIVNNMIADNTIQDVKIANLSYSKLTGAPSGLPPTGTAGGDLTGTYPSPSVAASAITTAKIAANAVTHSQLGAQAVQPATDIQPNGSYKDMLRTNNGATAIEFFTPPVIFTSGVVVPTANSLKIPQVNSGATDFQMVASTTLGRILQMLETQDVTPDSTTNTGALTTLPTTSTTKVNANLQQAITPISASSTLLVEVGVNLNSSTNPTSTIAALFVDSGTNAVAAASFATTDTGRMVQIILRYKVASGSTSARTYKVGFGSVAGTTRYNSVDGSTTMFGGTLGVNSWIRVTEYI